VYDELFSTVTSTELQLEALNNNMTFRLEQWNELIIAGYERDEALLEAEATGTNLPLLGEEWLSPPELAEREELRTRRMARRHLARGDIINNTPGQPVRTQPIPVQPLQVPMNAINPIQPTPLRVDGNDADLVAEDNGIENAQGVIETVQENNEDSTSTGVPEVSSTSPPRDVRTRGSARQRERKANKKFFSEEWVNYQQSNKTKDSS
jgi:hypothetical protein